jgi:hypothetical protein
VLVKAHIGHPIVRLKRGPQEERFVHDPHRKLIERSAPSNCLRIDHGRPVIILEVLIVAGDLEDIVNLEPRKKHGTDPVMDQTSRHFRRNVPGGRDYNDLPLAHRGGALGVFQCPEEATARPNPLLEDPVSGFQVGIPSSDCFGFQIRGTQAVRNQKQGEQHQKSD